MIDLKCSHLTHTVKKMVIISSDRYVNDLDCGGNFTAYTLCISNHNCIPQIYTIFNFQIYLNKKIKMNSI